jgi:hypothetical protein
MVCTHTISILTLLASIFRGKLLKKFDVPLENMYNMDEKGIQLGGGWQLDGTKYIYLKDLEMM